MKFLCDSCEKYPCDDNAIKLMKYCPVYSPKPKPQTNADRIRSMTDEELAKWLVLIEQRILELQPTLERHELLTDWFKWLKER